MVMRLRGGGGTLEGLARREAERAAIEAERIATARTLEQLSLAAGGTIEQVIHADLSSSNAWDTENSVMFNVTLVDAGAFPSLGLPQPSTPIDAALYASYGYPFYKLYEEKSGVHGTFDVKTVGQLDDELACNENSHDEEDDLVFNQVAINSPVEECSERCEVALNQVEPISKFFPYLLKTMP